MKDLLVTHSHENCGVRPVCVLGNQSLELTDSHVESHVGVIPVCCDVQITVISIFLHLLCHSVKGLQIAFDIKQHL